MKIRMLVQVTGTRNGSAWPAPGETIDVPAAEAEDLVDQGRAEKVSKPRKTSRR